MNAEATEVVVSLEDLGRVLVTAKVETHALAGVSLTITRGEYVSGARAFRFREDYTAVDPWSPGSTFERSIRLTRRGGRNAWPSRRVRGCGTATSGSCSRRGKTLCVVSHNPKYLEAADRVVTLTEGRLTD